MENLRNTEKGGLNKMEKQPIRVAQIMGKWLGGGVESVVMNYYRHINREKIQFDFICDNDSTDIPFKIIDNEEMEQMKESIADNGVLIPALVRPKSDGRYEMISGHRRKFASQLALKETMNIIFERQNRLI